jgi:hypothetical protein
MLELSCNIFFGVIIYFLRFNNTKVEPLSIEKIVVTQRKAVTFWKVTIFAM